WHKEAEKRGLPNLKNTVDALPIIIRKDSIDLFTKYKVYTERELQSRFVILAENYVKTVNIEAQLTVHMGRNMILPAALRYLTEAANPVTATKAAGVDNGAQLELLKTLSKTTSDFQAAIGTLEKALHHHPEGEPIDHAKYFRDQVLTAMASVR